MELSLHLLSTGILKYSADDNDVAGTVKHALFRLGEIDFMAMDSSLNHLFGFNEFLHPIKVM